MPDRPDPAIGGTVVERSFVATDLPAIVFAATVPVAELKYPVADEAQLLRALVADLLAIPADAPIDEHQYLALVRAAAREFTEDRQPFPPLWVGWEDWWDLRREQWVSLRQEMRTERRMVRTFAEHAVALLVAQRQIGTPTWPAWFLPSTRSISRRVGLELDDVPLSAGMACLAARLERSAKAERFTDALLQYHLPLGQSPRTQSDSLLKLLESGKKMCLAPMAAGGTLGIAQLTQGQYLAAILSVGTGSVMTLILLASVAVGSLVVNRVARVRDRGRQ